jgi:hypothetical protein
MTRGPRRRGGMAGCDPGRYALKGQQFSVAVSVRAVPQRPGTKGFREWKSK